MHFLHNGSIPVRYAIIESLNFHRSDCFEGEVNDRPLW